MSKRLIDIVLAGLLIVLVSPFLLIIVAILAITGERKVFYSQSRIGRFGQPFRSYKFVTMIAGSSKMAAGTLTVPDDPRVLPVGRFLRKTKLNELPQLWNVIKGNMSLVGPRPLTADDFACYSKEVQRTVIKVPPGLTGIGSIVFRDEEKRLAESDLPPRDCYRQEIAPRKGALEVWYVQNQSLLLDLELLVLTVVAVLAPGSTLHERVLRLPRDPASEQPA